MLNTLILTAGISAFSIRKRRGREGRTCLLMLDCPQAAHRTLRDEIRKEPPQPWRCGDLFQHCLPEPEGDPWNSLLKPLSERDTIQCNAWVDEVQNLLIFAGLFSAVVTAFAVETYQDLQEDPVVALLSQIASNSANNGYVGLPPPFIPGASTVRLNVFFFLSLILSLSTVIVGIVALQWIREHRKHSNALNPQNTFATLHMRNEALQKWRVPHIFAALPLLLQFALASFFAGIFQLLVDANTIVLIPVACVMGATILFLVLTTILPTVQAAILTDSRDDIPAPCPYKSPQANAFRQLITSSETLFRTTLFSFAAVYWLVLHLVLFPQKALALLCYSRAMTLLLHSVQRASSCAFSLYQAVLYQFSPLLCPFLNSKCEKWRGFDYMEPQIFIFWSLPSWFQFDIAWMSVRDNYFQSICPPESWLFQHREQRREYAALYDATQGLSYELTKANFNLHSNIEPAIVTAYHCALELCAPSAGYMDTGGTAVESHFLRNQYLARMLGLGDVTPLRPFSDKLGHANLSVFRDEASFIFLSFIQRHLDNINGKSVLLTDHYAEIYLRLLGELYREPYEMNSVVHDTQSIDVAFHEEDLYIMEIYDTPNQPFTHQWALSITSFFSVLGDRQIPQRTIATSFHAHPFFHSYSDYFWRQVEYEIETRTIQESTIDETINALSVIHDVLAECFTPFDNTGVDHHAQDIFNFKSAAVHLWNYKNRDIVPHLISETADSTLDSLREAQKRLLSFLGCALAVERNFGTIVDHGWLTEGWWVELFPKTTGEETMSAVASPSHSRGELVIEFHDS